MCIRWYRLAAVCALRKGLRFFRELGLFRVWRLAPEPRLASEVRSFGVSLRGLLCSVCLQNGLEYHDMS